MNLQDFSKSHQKPLATLALFGFIVPNGIFLYHAGSDPSAICRTLADPIAATFIGEAFLLMGLMAWLIKATGHRKPSWVCFVVMSLIGSLAFSIPGFLWLLGRKSDKGAST